MYSLGDGKSKAADVGRVGSREMDPALIPAQEIPAEAIGRSLSSSTLASSTNTGHEAILLRTAQRMTMWGQVRLQTARVSNGLEGGEGLPRRGHPGRTISHILIQPWLLHSIQPLGSDRVNLIRVSRLCRDYLLYF